MRSYRSLAVTTLLAFTSVLGACSDSSTEPEADPEPETVPQVVLIQATDLGSFDTEEYKTSCTASVDGQSACPVVRWDGVDYVGLSYRDNRFSMAIHAFDASGNVLGVREFTGARYLADVQLDSGARTANFVGQDEQTISLAWTELKALH